MNVAISIIKGLVALLKEARFDGVTSVGATNIAGILKAAEQFVVTEEESPTIPEGLILQEDDNEVTV